MFPSNQVATRINSFELAYRMQSSAPEAIDLRREDSATLNVAVPRVFKLARNKMWVAGPEDSFRAWHATKHKAKVMFATM